MISKRTDAFKRMFSNLPAKIKVLATKSYKLWKDDNYHPGLHFEKIHKNIKSVRIGRNYRVLGYIKDDTIYWFWIGSHEDYNMLLNNLKQIVKN